MKANLSAHTDHHRVAVMMGGLGGSGSKTFRSNTDVEVDSRKVDASKEGLKRMHGREKVELVSLSDPGEFSWIVGRLGRDKVAAINAIGYGYMQQIGCPELIGSIWKMMVENVDLMNYTVAIHGHYFPLTSDEFSRVMGIHDGGEEVELGGSIEPIEYGSVCELMCDSEGKIQVSLLKKIVRDRPEVDDTFRIAYALLAHTALLTPGTSDVVDKSLLIALIETRHVVRKNWASLCLNRLMESIMVQREEGNPVVGECVLFLQVLYLDKVGEACMRLDRKILPLMLWGKSEVQQLLKKVTKVGGHKSPTVMINTAKRSKKMMSTNNRDGTVGLGLDRSVHEDIYEVKVDLGHVVSDLGWLRDIVGRLHPEFNELINKVERLIQSVTNIKEECVREVIEEMRKMGEYMGDQVVPESNTSDIDRTAKRMDPKAWTENKATQNHLGRARLGSFKLPPTLSNRTTNGMPKGSPEKCNEGNCSPVVSASSSGSTWPPIRASRTANIHVDCGVKGVTKGLARALFPSAVNEDEAMHYLTGLVDCDPQSPWEVERYHVGPYHLKKPLEGDEMRLINFIFMAGKDLSREEKRTLVAAFGNDRALLYRDEIICLQPRTYVNTPVINYVSEYMNCEGSNSWYFPTFFEKKASAYDPTETFQDWVENTRSVCNLDRFNGQLHNCEKIFVPLHEEGDGGHWYLMVVLVREKVVEIWDSYPSVEKEANRWGHAITTLRHLDHVLSLETVKYKGATISFGTFDIIVPEGVPLQKNGYDCGIYVIQNMLQYGKKWAEEYESHEERAMVLLDCMRFSHNDMHSLIPEGNMGSGYGVEHDKEEVCEKGKLNKTKPFSAWDASDFCDLPTLVDIFGMYGDGGPSGGSKMGLVVDDVGGELGEISVLKSPKSN